MNPVQLFLEEAQELFEDIEKLCLSLAAGADAGETINQLFRALHTIKGSAGRCGLDDLSSFTHSVESLVHGARTGAIAADGTLADLVLRCNDVLRSTIEDAAHDVPANRSAMEELAACMDHYASPKEPSLQQSSPVSEWVIDFEPDAQLLARGGDPLALLDELRLLGECRVECDLSRLPSLDVIEPEQCYLGWKIRLRTDAGEEGIRAVFRLVQEPRTPEEGRLEIRQAPPVQAPPSKLVNTATGLAGKPGGRTW